MKKHTYGFVVLLALTVSVAGSTAFAQDSGLPDYEIIESDRDRLDREKIMYSPGEGEIRYIPSRSSANSIDPKSTGGSSKDSVATKSTPPIVQPAAKVKTETAPKSPAKQQPPKEDDDAILSFNFLYYIIQKYKLQDIVE